MGEKVPSDFFFFQVKAQVQRRSKVFVRSFSLNLLGLCILWLVGCVEA